MKSAAVITLKSPGKYTKTGRRQIVLWLRRQAKFLEKHGDKYTNGIFRARYLYAGD